VSITFTSTHLHKFQPSQQQQTHFLGNNNRNRYCTSLPNCCLGEALSMLLIEVELKKEGNVEEKRTLKF